MDSLNQLIERLQQLHLEQARILQALENIIAVAPADNRNECDVTPTTVPVAAIIATVPVPAPTPTVHNIEPVATVIATVPVPAPTMFHIGQQVYIINHITHVLVRRATEADRTAIVTHFTASGHVVIRTINGFHTHQHPKNLHPL
jgi:hypothetical protein